MRLLLAGGVAALDLLGVPLADQFQATVTSLPFGSLVFDWLLGFRWRTRAAGFVAGRAVGDVV